MKPQIIESCAGFSTVGDLINYLQSFSPDTVVCGIGGGEVTVSQQIDYPDCLWFE